jgi:hypothetical protein
MIGFYDFNTEVVEHVADKPKFPEVFSTRLPKQVAVIRAVATVWLGCLVAELAVGTVFVWPAVVVGVAFAGWTLYSNFIAKDAMLETFYKIAGSKENFYALPETQLSFDRGESLMQAVFALKSNFSNPAMSRAKTPDGRDVVIVRGRVFSETYKEDVPKIFAFVERLSHHDYSDKAHSQEAFNFMTDHAIFKPFTGHIEPIKYDDDLFTWTATVGDKTEERGCGRLFEMTHSIDKRLAETLFAQSR